MTTPGEIVKARREALGLTQTDLSRRSGVKLNTLRDIELKGGQQSSKLPALAKTLGLDAIALSEGRRQDANRAISNLGDDFGFNSEPLESLSAEEREKRWANFTAQNHRSAGETVIHRFDTGGAMGHGLELPDQPGIIESVRVSAEWMQKNVRNYTAISNLRIVTGFGDSMRPMFNPGDPLIVDCGVQTADFDAIYFFRVGNEGFVKRLQRIPTPSGLSIRVHSANKEYDTWDIEAGMDFEVFGRVLKVWRSEDF